MQTTSSIGNFPSSKPLNQIISEAMDQSRLLNFYYKSNNSTDNNLLELFPLGIEKTHNGLQLMAIKIVNDEYVMRRYNLNNISTLSIGEVAWKTTEWKDLKKDKDNYFTTSIDSTINKNLEAVYDWDVWGVGAVTEADDEADDELSAEDFIIKDLNGDGVPKSFFFLPSNPTVLFCGTSHHYYKMAKRTVERNSFTGNSSEALLVMKSITPKEVFKIEDFNVGDVVKFNVPENSAWSNLKVTVSSINKGRDSLGCVGVDKDNNVYIMHISPQHIMPVTEKTKLRVVSNYQAPKATAPDSRWD